MATQAAATIIHTNATFTSPAIAIEPPISPQQWLLPAACPCFYQHQSRLYYYLPLYPHPRSPAGYHSAPILFKGTVLFGRDHRHQSLGDCSQSASDFKGGCICTIPTLISAVGSVVSRRSLRSTQTYKNGILPAEIMPHMWGDTYYSYVGCPLVRRQSQSNYAHINDANSVNVINIRLQLFVTEQIR